LKGIPLAREGLPFIIPSLILAILFYALHIEILFVICCLFLLFFLFFFRNPKRLRDTDENILISPADGKIMEIKEIHESEYVGRKTKRISIFMSPLDVHVNRTPCGGHILMALHKEGEFAVAFKKDIDKENERNYILIDHHGEKVLIVQIAGFLARRIICYVKEGDKVKQGDPVGMIAFGSRVDIYIPEGYDAMVELNSKVKAGLTPLAVKRG